MARGLLLIALGAGALLALLGLLFALSPQPAGPPQPAPAPAPPAPAGSGAVLLLGERGGTPWDASRHQGPVRIRLEAAGPRQARVWLETELLGRLAVDEQGRHSGEAIGRVMNVARLLANREVIVAPDPGVAPGLPAGIVGLVRQGGCLRVQIQPGPG